MSGAFEIPADPTNEALRGGYASGRATQLLLLTTAERLFAERGIGFVSLREIAQTANQKNKAIMQYYFGNKDGLIASIRAYRREQIQQRRLELLPSPEAERLLGNDLDSILGLVLRPHAETMLEPDNHFLGFQARLLSEGLGPSAPGHAKGEDTAGYWRLRRLARACVPTLSEERFAERFDLVFSWGIHALAEYAHGRAEVDAAALDQRLAELAAMLANALRAQHEPALT
jgi:AcrR family transcriptional regulator